MHEFVSWVRSRTTGIVLQGQVQLDVTWQTDEFAGCERCPLTDILYYRPASLVCHKICSNWIMIGWLQLVACNNAEQHQLGRVRDKSSGCWPTVAEKLFHLMEGMWSMC